MMEAFAVYLKEYGWNIEWNETRNGRLPEAIQNRYKAIPQSWMDLIKGMKRMINADETMWFLCADDFAMQGGEAFQWNEWERLSLESAGNNAAWRGEIKRFWDGHLPFVMSVKGGYSYYAITVKDGSVVYGAEPEFEECETVAASFTDFVDKILKGELRL